MFNYLASFKNHFLQKQLKHLYPEPIQDMVREEFKRETAKRNKCRIGAEEDPKECRSSTYFEDRAQLAYGWFALPKLVRELCSADHLTHWRAINSLSEYLMNPLNAQRAIEEFEIVRRCNNAFLRYRLGYLKQQHREVERLLVIFRICSVYLNGAVQIAHKPNLFPEFYKIVMGNEQHEELAAQILRNLTEKPEVLLFMLNETDAFELITKAFQADPCRPHYPIEFWTHLAHFLEIAPERGIEHGFFELLHGRVMRRIRHYHRANLKCFALLFRCEEGQKRFDAIDGVKMLYDILQEKYIVKFEYIVFALMHGVMSKKALWRCREFTKLPGIVLELAENTRHAQQQLHCIQVLRQLSEMPCIKKYIKEKYLLRLHSLKACDGKCECAKDEILALLRRELWHSQA